MFSFLGPDTSQGPSSTPDQGLCNEDLRLSTREVENPNCKLLVEVYHLEGLMINVSRSPLYVSIPIPKIAHNVQARPI